MTRARRMGAFLALLALLLATSASGQQSADKAERPAPTRVPRIIDIDIPEDFKPATRNAAGAAATLNGEPHLGGLKFAGTVEALLRKDGPITIFITSMVSADKVAYPDASIHSEFELLRNSPTAGSLQPTDVESVSWKTDLVDGGARADLHWRHLVYETETHVRALAYRDKAGHLNYAQAECIHPLEKSPGSPTPLGTLCDAVLATMAIPDPESGPRATVDPTALAALEGADGTSSASDDRPLDQLPDLTLRDPGALGGQPLPAIPTDKPEKRDYRQLLVILGGLLLLVGFYFTSRSRSAAAPIGDDGDDSDDGDAEKPATTKEKS